MLVQLISCSNETEQTASNPQVDSAQNATPEPEHTAANGDEIAPPIEVSPSEIKKTLLARGKWLQFGIIPVHKSDSDILENYNKHYFEKMKDFNRKPIEETLTFSESNNYTHECEFEPKTKNMVGEDLPIWEKGKDSKISRSGTFEITEQNILFLNAGKKANLNDEKLKMVSLSTDRFIIVDTLSFKGVKFPVYKVYLRAN